MANKPGKLGRNSDNENGTRAMIAIGGQGDSQRGDPERGRGGELGQKPGRGPERKTETRLRPLRYGSRGGEEKQ